MAGDGPTLLDKWHVLLALITERDACPARGDLAVAVALLDHPFIDRGAYIAVDDLVENTGLARTSVMAALERLMAAGFFRCERSGQGRGFANRYFAAFERGVSTLPLSREKRTARDTLYTQEKVAPTGPLREERVASTAPISGEKGSVHRTKRVASTGHHTSTRYEIDPLESLSAPQKRSSLQAAFDRFMATFPKQDRRDAAEREFGRLIRNRAATVGQLLDAAKAYAAAKSSTEPRYIRNAASWLRDGDWRDSPGPSGSSPEGTQRRGRGHREDPDEAATRAARNFYSPAEEPT